MGGRGSSSMGSKAQKITTDGGMKVKAQVLHGADFFKADAISVGYGGRDSKAYPVLNSESDLPDGFVEDAYFYSHSITSDRKGAAGFRMYSNNRSLEQQYVKSGMNSYDAAVKAIKETKYVWVKSDWVNNAKSTSLEKGAAMNEKRGFKAYKIL